MATALNSGGLDCLLLLRSCWDILLCGEIERLPFNSFPVNTEHSSARTLKKVKERFSFSWSSPLRYLNGWYVTRLKSHGHKLQHDQEKTLFSICHLISVKHGVLSLSQQTNHTTNSKRNCSQFTQEGIDRVLLSWLDRPPFYLFPAYCSNHHEELWYCAAVPVDRPLGGTGRCQGAKFVLGVSPGIYGTLTLW